jgi:ABC-type tungstate transport system substrate-binding protein
MSGRAFGSAPFFVQKFNRLQALCYAAMERAEMRQTAVIVMLLFLLLSAGAYFAMQRSYFTLAGVVFGALLGLAFVVAAYTVDAWWPDGG